MGYQLKWVWWKSNTTCMCVRETERISRLNLQLNLPYNTNTQIKTKSFFVIHLTQHHPVHKHESCENHLIVWECKSINYKPSSSCITIIWNRLKYVTLGQFVLSALLWKNPGPPSQLSRAFLCVFLWLWNIIEFKHSIQH